MSKQEYLDALRNALAGLPPETVAKTLAFYEQRFIDGMTAGQSEAEITADLDPPRKIAMTLRANVHLRDFEQRRNPASLMRMLVSLIGLGIFNLFMVVPAMVFSALLFTLYVCALSFYLGGVAITASGLSGQNELALQGPLRELILRADSDGRDDEDSYQAHMSISSMGIQLSKDPDTSSSDEGSPKLLDRAEALANGDLKVTSDFDTGSRTIQSMVGMGFVLMGIGLSLLSIVVTRHTVAALKRYVAMNISLLRGH